MRNEIGNRLYELRREKDISQDQVASGIGVEKEVYASWELGDGKPDADQLIALAKFYNMSLDELVGLEVKDDEEEVIDGEIVDAVPLVDEDEEDVIHQHRKRRFISKLNAFVNAFGFVICLTIYIVIGCTVRGGIDESYNLGWQAGWALLLAPAIVGSIISAIEHKRFCEIVVPLLIVAIYCPMGIIGAAYGINLWHPYWFLFLLIPFYYSIFGVIDATIMLKRRHNKKLK